MPLVKVLSAMYQCATVQSQESDLHEPSWVLVVFVTTFCVSPVRLILQRCSMVCQGQSRLTIAALYYGSNGI